MPSSDVLVIGTGIAGLSAALKAAEWAKVTVLCKGAAAATNTSLAQGGMAAVLLPEDSPDQHVADTLAAGSGKNKPEAALLLAQSSPACVQALLALGVPFDKKEDGSLALGLEGGHSHRRIVHAKDQTGCHIQQHLLQTVRQHPNISLLEHQVALDLLLEDVATGRRCVGVAVLDVEHSCRRKFYAKATILATGGAGQLYQHTTNPALATGDGLAMAARAGVALADLEFVQFHPTTLYNPGKPVFLVSEAVRGFGAELVLPGGERFMHRYHQQGSLAPRDVVSQAMQQEMERLAAPCLYLDLRHLPMDAFMEKFPTIYESLRLQHIDPRYDLVPVVPAAHYMCGGIKTDLDGASSLPGLYACGECASTGLHGANRLASNSLPEAWIMGQRAAEHSRSLLLQPFAASLKDAADSFVPLEASAPLASLLRQQLQEGMWQYVGIVRTPAGLNKCLRLLDQLHVEVENMLARGELNQDWVELQNLIEVGQLVVKSALNRPESCGCHCMLGEKSAKPAYQKDQKPEVLLDMLA